MLRQEADTTGPIAWYEAADDVFVLTPPSTIIQALQHRCARHFELMSAEQYASWEDSIPRLQRALAARTNTGLQRFAWHVILEYPLARLGKRIDCVLVGGPIILVIEFKRGPSSSVAAAIRQAEEYAFCLAHFHAASHGRSVRAAALGEFERIDVPDSCDGPRAAILNWEALPGFLRQVSLSAAACSEAMSPSEWLAAPYRSTPSIIEAARELYQNHSVGGLRLSGADDEELATTTRAVLQQVQRAKTKREKVVVFVTGVPGAGKTLVGLNVVQAVRSAPEPSRDDQAVMLSGNGPLVKVLRAALKRDAREKGMGPSRRYLDGSSVDAFISEMHRFTSDNAARTSAPSEHVVVFDEAQRAWDREKCDEYAVRRARRAMRAGGAEENVHTAPGLSEAELVLDILFRHDWAVLVCLVGPGQEIYRGEGGLNCWKEALQTRPTWRTVGSAQFLATEVGTVFAHDVTIDPALHLATSRRSLLAQGVTEWVDAVLEGDSAKAASLARSITGFPFGRCRTASALRHHLRVRDVGTPRIGVLASSGALRLRAAGFEPPAYNFTQNVVDPVAWFLNSTDDIRSSNQLEVPMSEFESQGLELDVTGVCWGGDLIRSTDTIDWQPQRMRGTRWVPIAPTSPDGRYIVNKYRVLLTRFRRSCVIMVPEGEPEDRTQQSESMDAVFAFLQTCGVPVLS